MPRVRVPKTKLWKAIRKFCLECVCNQPEEVRLCAFPQCALYPYRMGRVIQPDSADPKDQKKVQARKSSFTRRKVSAV